MDARVTISKETQAHFDNPIQLNKKRKRQLRIASMIAYLDSHDNLATTQQLFQAAGYTSHIEPVKAKQNGAAFIQSLLKTGVFKKEPHKGNIKRWTLLKTEPIGPKPVVETVKVKVLDIELLQTKAKEFYWAQKSDSLHDFIDTLVKEGNGNGSE